MIFNLPEIYFSRKFKVSILKLISTTFAFFFLESQNILERTKNLFLQVKFLFSVLIKTYKNSRVEYKNVCEDNAIVLQVLNIYRNSAFLFEYERIVFINQIVEIFQRKKNALKKYFLKIYLPYILSDREAILFVLQENFCKRLTKDVVFRNGLFIILGKIKLNLKTEIIC